MTLITAGLLGGCGISSGAETPAVSAETVKTTEENEMKIYIPNEENVKQIGRTELIDDTLWCALSGSGAEFLVSASRAEITVAGDNIAVISDNDSNYARYAIYVNDEKVVDEVMNKPEKTHVIFDGDTEQEAVVRIIKLSESAMSTIGIRDIAVNSDTAVRPAAEKKHKIEFIGDSITCGYGVDDEDKDHHFSTATEDVTKAYAYKTAEALDADYSMVAYSGHGIISGYTDNGQKTQQLVPKYYKRTGFSYGSFAGRQVSAIDWDFSRFEPELIVINLGTNDDSYCQNDSARQEEFAKQYTVFLKQIREKNPDAKILCTLGIMGSRLYDYIELAVYNYTQETGDDNIATFKFDNQEPSDGLAADWHPTEATQDKAAKKLTAEISELMGW